MLSKNRKLIPHVHTISKQNIKDARAAISEIGLAVWRYVYSGCFSRVFDKSVSRQSVAAV
jgi:hypothetical protein